MPHIYTAVRTLEGTPKLGDFQCVYLVKHFTKLRWTGGWKQGESVVGNKNIQIGTAIATFVNGKWPGLETGNHSGFYMGQTSEGIYIMDQWPRKEKVGKRFIRRRGKDANGNFIAPEDNADAFSIIE